MKSITHIMAMLQSLIGTEMEFLALVCRMIKIAKNLD
jgi:hypothetical protein